MGTLSRNINCKAEPHPPRRETIKLTDEAFFVSLWSPFPTMWGRSAHLRRAGKGFQSFVAEAMAGRCRRRFCVRRRRTSPSPHRGEGGPAQGDQKRKREQWPPKPVDEVPILDGKLNSSFATERYIRLVSYPSTCYRRSRFCSERLIAANTDRKA